MSTIVNKAGGMRPVHPNSVSGVLMTVGFLDQTGDKKLKRVPNQLRVWAGGQSTGVGPSP